MLNLKRIFKAAFLLCALSGAQAQAARICKAATHGRYGETRAYFKDVLAGCDPTGRCYVAAHVPDHGQGFQYLQQMRAQRLTLDAPFDLRFVSVDPMADPRKRFALSIGDEAWDLTNSFALAANSANEYLVTDQALTQTLAQRLRGGRSAVWIYTGETGETAVARFGLRGADQAFNWIECMQKGR